MNKQQFRLSLLAVALASAFSAGQVIAADTVLIDSDRFVINDVTNSYEQSIVSATKLSVDLPDPTAFPQIGGAALEGTILTLGVGPDTPSTAQLSADSAGGLILNNVAGIALTDSSGGYVGIGVDGFATGALAGGSISASGNIVTNTGYVKANGVTVGGSTNAVTGVDSISTTGGTLNLNDSGINNSGAITTNNALINAGTSTVTAHGVVVGDGANTITGLGTIAAQGNVLGITGDTTVTGTLSTLTGGANLDVNTTPGQAQLQTATGGVNNTATANVQDGQASLTVLNNTTGNTHGVTVGTTQTEITGGTNSATLTLRDGDDTSGAIPAGTSLTVSGSTAGTAQTVLQATTDLNSLNSVVTLGSAQHVAVTDVSTTIVQGGANNIQVNGTTGTTVTGNTTMNGTLSIDANGTAANGSTLSFDNSSGSAAGNGFNVKIDDGAGTSLSTLTLNGTGLAAVGTTNAIIGGTGLNEGTTIGTGGTATAVTGNRAIVDGTSARLVSANDSNNVTVNDGAGVDMAGNGAAAALNVNAGISTDSQNTFLSLGGTGLGATDNGNVSLFANGDTTNAGGIVRVGASNDGGGALGANSQGLVVNASTATDAMTGLAASTTELTGGSATAASTVKLDAVQASMKTADNRGLTVNTAATGGVSLIGGMTTIDAGARTAGLNISQDGETVSLLNNANSNGAATSGHGLTIGAATTTLSGGTNSSVLTLEDGAGLAAAGGTTLTVGGSSGTGIQLFQATTTANSDASAVTIGSLGSVGVTGTVNTVQGSSNNITATDTNTITGNQNNVYGRTTIDTDNVGGTAGSTLTMVDGSAELASSNTGSRLVMTTTVGVTTGGATLTGQTDVLGNNADNRITVLADGGTIGTSLAGVGGNNALGVGVQIAGTSTNAAGTAIKLLGTDSANFTATATLSGQTASYKTNSATGSAGLDINLTTANTTTLKGGDGSNNAAVATLGTGSASLLSGAASGNRGLNITSAVSGANTNTTTLLTGGSNVTATGAAVNTSTVQLDNTSARIQAPANVVGAGTNGFVATQDAGTQVVGVNTGANGVSITGTGTTNGVLLTGNSSTAVASTVKLNSTVASIQTGTQTAGTAGGGGLVVTDTTSAVLTGGTEAGGTSLTLRDNGATFAHNGSGGPVQVHGVADGTTDFDAVNWRQLKKAYAGVAAVSALSAIPAPMPGKNHSVGIGYGHFMSQDAIAIGYKGIVNQNMQVTAGLGHASGQTTYNVGAGWSW